MSSDLRTEYDRLAEKFAAWTPTRQFKEVFARTVLHRLEQIRDREALVLDAGCGHGNWLLHVWEHMQSRSLKVRAWGIDLSPRRIEFAQQRLAVHREIELRCDSLESTSLPTNLDLIYVMEVFSHIRPPVQADLLRRWFTTLRPGGAVVIIDKDRISRHSIKLELQKLTGSLLRKVWGRRMLFTPEYDALVRLIHYPSFRYLAKAGQAAGFRAEPFVRVHEFTGLVLVRPT